MPTELCGCFDSIVLVFVSICLLFVSVALAYGLHRTNKLRRQYEDLARRVSQVD